MGGMLPAAAGFRQSIEEYDPTTNEWTLLKDLPYPVAFSNAVVLEGEMYLIGGYGAGTLKSVISTIDPVAGDWDQKENLLFARESAGACVYKGRIYYMGGWDSASTPQSTVMQYDPSTDKWKEMAEMPRSRAGFALAAAGNRILAIGGHSAQGNTTVSVIDIYDPEADEWIGEIPMPSGRSWFSLSVVNNEIYLIGGSPFFDAWGWPPNELVGPLEKLSLPGWFSVSFHNKLRTTWGKIRNNSRKNPRGIP
jgi:N-acetylneuraminic acid mutarotase